MDSLQKCAKAFDQLTRYQYHFVIGRKGQTLKFTVSFDPSDFHHLAGLHKLKDNVRLQTGQRSTIFRDVLDGKYPFEQIKHSAYFREMEQRLTPLAHLEEFLDSNEIIFRYNEKANRFSAIQADYLLLNDVKEIACKSAIYDDSKIYSRGLSSLAQFSGCGSAIFSGRQRETHQRALCQSVAVRAADRG